VAIAAILTFFNVVNDRPYTVSVFVRARWLGFARRFLCLCLLVLSPAASIAASDPAYDHHLFIDKNFQFDIHSIDRAPFEVSKRKLNLGYQSAPIWVRLRITASPSEHAADADTGRLILRVGPHDINQIEVYEFVEGRWHVQIMGDLFSEKKKLCADDYYCIQLRDASVQAGTVYLKIQTNNFLVLDTELVTLESLSIVSSARIKRIFISLTLASVMLVIGIFWVIKYQSKMTVFFTGLQFSILIYQLCIYGFPAAWFPDWPPAVLDALPSLLFISRTFLTVLTIFVVIKAYCNSSLYFKLVYLTIACCLFNAVLYFTEHRNFAIQFNLVVFSLYPAVHLFGVLKSKGMVKNVERLFFASFFLFYIVLLPVVLGGIFSDFFNGFVGPIQNISDWRLNGLIVGGVIFFVIKFEEEHREKQKAEELNQIRIDRIEADSYAALLSDRNTMIDLLTHDLKNPLGTITFASRSLKEQLQDNQTATQKLRHIDQCVNRMNNLIEHVAVSARLDRYESVASPTFSSAAELIEELTETYTDQSRFHVNVDPHASFNADRDMLTVIFGNLINNAYKYGHTGGDISITVQRTSDMGSADLKEIELAASATESLCFEISNAVGSFGMPDQTRIFERYYRHPNSVAVPGMGLGLSLVKAAAAKIGASVDFRQARDRVIFTVRVPN
jgi:two-component system, sensor histidine kinase LadS